VRTEDTIFIAAPAAAVFQVAADVERWPDILPHYRYVRFTSRAADGAAIVEMAAWRPFGVVRWPVWWISEMSSVPDQHIIRYRHIRGITSGMDVEWRIVGQAGGSVVTIIHEWNGPRWPAIGRPAADFVIGPVFIHGIASRTLAGIGRWITTHSPAGSPAARADHAC
jgi:hypothetical protein